MKRADVVGSADYLFSLVISGVSYFSFARTLEVKGAMALVDIFWVEMSVGGLESGVLAGWAWMTAM